MPRGSHGIRSWDCEESCDSLWIIIKSENVLKFSQIETEKLKALIPIKIIRTEKR